MILISEKVRETLFRKVLFGALKKYISNNNNGTVMGLALSRDLDEFFES